MIGDFTALTLIGLVLVSGLIQIMEKNLISDSNPEWGQLLNLIGWGIFVLIWAMIVISILEALAFIQGNMAWLIILF